MKKSKESKQENIDTGYEVISEQPKRDTKGDIIKRLKKDIVLAVKTGDYIKASNLKQQLKEFKEVM